MFQPVLLTCGLFTLMPPRVTGNSIRKSIKLKYIKPVLCKITYFFVAYQCMSHQPWRGSKKEEKKVEKSILSPEDEDRHCYFSCGCFSLYPKNQGTFWEWFWDTEDWSG